jgi:hypothetical protein
LSTALVIGGAATDTVQRSLQDVRVLRTDAPGMEVKA